ncbi:AIPR protein [Janthinobacterium sp. HH103]|uniref:AIPR family protein n=1 Tax=unclassified Janthinobacterium TaxID=2610881 RepID=UPI000893147C|nr:MULTISPECIES: AIPR family protein [unclassified Janthinobacterium]OEZ54102.1 AIPR protein [Janthinobacterium sp. HH100]OEZ85840.1 AIPR protein [Janthinobacterium sp. HH103]QOU73587.1 AIPR protein [Janthinobacterium sp. HH102]
MATKTTQKTEKIKDPRKELIEAIDAVAKRGGISRDRAIAAWYATTLLGIDEDEAIDAASVDGPEDGGCDFIYVDTDQETVYVLQGYVAERSDRSAPLKKWNALVAAVSSIKDPISFEHAGRADIQTRLQDLDIQNLTLVFGLVTLAAKSDQIARQKESTIRSKTYGPDVSFFYEHQDTLYDKYLIAKTADRTVPEDTLTFGNPLSEIRGDFGHAIIGSVAASELARWYAKYPNQLFEGNVRLFIGQRKGGINEKIIETAVNRPGEFWALNNGITIVADSIEEITKKKFTLRHFSIVNGCQTTVSLAKAIGISTTAEKAQVLVRVVGAKKTILTDIVRYNNTQNPVKLSAVRLLDPIQEGLRNSFLSIDYSYAPKQEGARVNKNPKRIELDKIAQYLAAMSEETILDAVRRKTELFDKVYKTIFPRGLQAERVFLAWLLAQQIETERMILLKANDSPDAVIKTILGIHGTPWGIFVASTLIDQSGSDLSKLTLQRMNTIEFSNAIAKYAKKAMELYSEIAVQIVDSEGDNTNTRNEIRVKPFLDKLKRTLALRMSKISIWKLPKLQNITSPA